MRAEIIEAQAEAVGLAVHWTDYAGVKQRVGTRVLRRILERVEIAGPRCAPLVTAEAGSPIDLPGREPVVIDQPGYHRILHGDETTIVAVAPKRAYRAKRAGWGLAAQIYGLRRNGDGGIGDTQALMQLGQTLVKHGAQAIALSPTHALYAGNPAHFSPYSPSSRLFLNPLLADPACIFGAETLRLARHGFEARLERCEARALIDWEEAGAIKYAVYRRLFDAMDNPDLREDLEAFRKAGGERLERHAQFEAQDERARELAFHIFLQWVADRCFGTLQAQLKTAGMEIGLIADLAIGADPSGSEVWSAPGDYLTGLTVGAPPDLLAARGQNWGLTALSPAAMRSGGFASFLALLRSALRHAGGVRIDHVLGLRRLWVIPDGESADQGAYLRLPFNDLARLIALESHLHGAVIIGEDLGTVPKGFRDDIRGYGISGLEVLWFQEKQGRFLPPQAWSDDAIAMSSTHDLPTLIGWWRGRDLAMRQRCGVLSKTRAAQERRLRTRHRMALWDAFIGAGLVRGPRPSSRDARPVAEAAIRFVARTRARLMLLPMEDLLMLEDQPNLPGTIDEHPNWRRRYPVESAALADSSDVAARLVWLRRRYA